MAEIVLWYVGKGSFLNGIPARHLTDLDLASWPLDASALVDSGLYVNECPVGVVIQDTGVLEKCACGTIDLRDGVDDAEARLASQALNKRRK